ncbi:unnamed protein product [Calicophoron daubneyi]|uniref:Retinol dehydrogenase 12 n=1 Tax=Calicophoron daubneyi TaxID=300641 RepID=A0AAV2T905_CALDB
MSGPVSSFWFQTNREVQRFDRRGMFSLSWLFYPFTLIIILVLWAIKKLHFDHKDCLLSNRLDGKLVVVTGCNCGIGFETVGELARRGARVIMACRDTRKCLAAREQLLARFGIQASGDSVAHNSSRNLTLIEEAQLICEELDLASVESVRSFARRLVQREHALHILVNNAAINLGHPKFDEQDGIEMHLKVNHLGHLLLTQLLYPLLAAAEHARVIMIASHMHRFAELNMADICRPLVGSCYSNSKLANVICALELTRRWADSNITAVSVHPGLVKTEIFRHRSWIQWLVHSLLPNWLARTPLEGCQTVVYCALTEDLVPGAYYSDCRISRVNPQALKTEVGDCLWNSSEQLINRWEVKSR